MSTKSSVLSNLEMHKGEYISGAELAEKCQVSRNAIWKAVNELREEGYSIESVNNKGYSLNVDSDIISEEGIKLYLASSLKKKKNASVEISIYKDIDSTNSQAKRNLISEDGIFSHGSVIIARRQSAGRGHDGSTFNSPDGGIYMSIILEPDKVKVGSSDVTRFIVEEVRNALQSSMDISLTIKNKSRLYQGRKKICGILTEGIVDMETDKYSNYIVGIGILFDEIVTRKNVNKNMIISEIIKDIIGLKEFL